MGSVRSIGALEQARGYLDRGFSDAYRHISDLQFSRLESPRSLCPVLRAVSDVKRSVEESPAWQLLECWFTPCRVSGCSASYASFRRRENSARSTFCNAGIMTVIAALRLEGVPALIGDFLLTDSRTDLQHFPLPTRQNVQDPVGQPLPHRIHGMERKCLIINDRFIVGFTGHVPAAKMLFGALEHKFAKQSDGPTLIQIDETLEGLKAEINRREYDAAIVGWTVRSRPRCFSWSPTHGSKTRSVQEAIVGSGATKFRAALTDYTLSGTSKSVVTAYDKATLRGINIIGRVLSDELVSGHNLITGYGYGAEVAFLNGTRFSFVSKIGYTFWNVRINENGIMSLQPGGVMGVYENKGRYALLNIIQYSSDDSGIKANNTYLAGLTPLHDNMGLILGHGDEPDIICDFYFMGFAVQDTRTGRMAMLRVACGAKEQSLIRVEQTGPGKKFLFHLDMGEVATMVRTVFPDAKW